jgi:hypothetical protein
MNKKAKLSKTWDWWKTAYNCKIQLSAEPGINGKLILQIVSVENAQAYVFMQPNTFDKSLSPTHGLLENNMVYAYDKRKTSGVYAVPSDWTVTIAYNVGMFSGSIVVETWLEEYTD